MAPSQRRRQRYACAGSAAAPNPSSNAPKPTIPQQAMSGPQPARSFGMVDAVPPPAEENPCNAAVKPW
ncbi:hypothetical protein IFR05_000357 [Cadophora sp. M221]|nr:hypothetical protein IFR05_000357 [Cadophora sp. M221]